MKKILSLVLILAVVLAMVLPLAVSAGPGDIGGSFGATNEAPVAGTITSSSPMTPYAQWSTITVPVSDANTIADINQVQVTFFYDIDKNSHTPPSAAAATCAIFTWTRTGGFVLTGPTSTTWAINAGGCGKPDDTATSGSWVFSFKVGKVATATTGSSGWDIYAVATDGSNATSNNHLYDQVMNWYGEVSSSSPTLDWGSPALGSGFAADTNKINNIPVTYISNGNYAEKVKSAANWTGTNSQTAIFDATGVCSSTNSFSLKACRTDAFGSVSQVDTTGVIIDNSSGTQTTETPDAVGTNTLWLKIASSFTKATYSGNVTYIIASR
jgi:hypothetical protein